MKQCTECGIDLGHSVIEYSLSNYGTPLCIPHQRWIDATSAYSTNEAIRLYFELKKRGVPAELEKYDGYKHIDIAIPEAKVNIEVDGCHHNVNSKQALTDLKRTYYSFLKGFVTLRIPNSLIYDEYTLNSTADFIVEILNKNRINVLTSQRK